MPQAPQIALAFLVIWSGSVHSVGLGSIRVQSGLGQPLKVSIPLIGADSVNLLPSCISSRIESADGAFLFTPVISLVGTGKDQFLQLSTRSSVNEPALSISIDLACGALVHRDFQILMDPVGSQETVAESLSTPVAKIRNSGRATPKGDPAGPTGSTGDFSVSRSTGAGIASNSQPRMGIRPADRLAITAKVAPEISRRSVLKLSSDGLTKEDLATLGHLKLSSQLASDGPPNDPALQKEIRAAQNQFAMILRGEDPLRNAELANQAQVTALKRQAAAAEARRTTGEAAFEDLRQNSIPLSLGLGLGALLLGSLAAAAWLGSRFLALKKQGAERPWDLSVLQAQAGYGAAAEAAGESNGKFEEEDADLFIARTASPVNLTSVPEFLRQAEPPQPDKIEHAVHEPLVFEETGKAFAAEGIGSRTVDAMSPDAVEALQFYPAKLDNLKVEEISDIMQEAEFWISLNDSARAIEILEPYAELDVPESPMPWLFLLDLYVAAGDQRKYELLRERALHRFNARVLPWDAVQGAESGMTLEDFPHVIDRICDLWRTDEIIPYLETLMRNTREESREGFDLAVYREIVLLISIARGFGPLIYAKSLGDKRQLSIE